MDVTIPALVGEPKVYSAGDVGEGGRGGRIGLTMQHYLFVPPARKLSFS
jgi:hypothetical protein